MVQTNSKPLQNCKLKDLLIKFLTNSYATEGNFNSRVTMIYIQIKKGEIAFKTPIVGNSGVKSSEMNLCTKHLVPEYSPESSKLQAVLNQQPGRLIDFTPVTVIHKVHQIRSWPRRN